MRNITLGATYSVLCSTAHKTDAATTQHGDLLDLIALSCGLDRLADVLTEARRFLGLAQPPPTARSEPQDGLPEAARRLLVMSYPLAGTVAETYLQNRGIAITPDLLTLRFHPRCFYRATDEVTGANHYEVICETCTLPPSFNFRRRTKLN